jgi:hypothetical protein
MSTRVVQQVREDLRQRVSVDLSRAVGHTGDIEDDLQIGRQPAGAFHLRLAHCSEVGRAGLDDRTLIQARELQ